MNRVVRTFVAAVCLILKVHIRITGGIAMPLKISKALLLCLA